MTRIDQIILVVSFGLSGGAWVMLILHLWDHPGDDDDE